MPVLQAGGLLAATRSSTPPPPPPSVPPQGPIDDPLRWLSRCVGYNALGVSTEQIRTSTVHGENHSLSDHQSVMSKMKHTVRMYTNTCFRTHLYAEKHRLQCIVRSDYRWYKEVVSWKVYTRNVFSKCFVVAKMADLTRTAFDTQHPETVGEPLINAHSEPAPTNLLYE